MQTQGVEVLTPCPHLGYTPRTLGASIFPSLLAPPPTSVSFVVVVIISNLPVLTVAFPKPCPHFYLPTPPLPSHVPIPTCQSCPHSETPPHPCFYLKIPPLSDLFPPSILWPRPLSNQPLTQGLEQQCAMQSKDEWSQVLQAHHCHIAVHPDHLRGRQWGL